MDSLCVFNTQWTCLTRTRSWILALSLNVLQYMYTYINVDQEFLKIVSWATAWSQGALQLLFWSFHIYINPRLKKNSLKVELRLFSLFSVGLAIWNFWITKCNLRHGEIVFRFEKKLEHFKVTIRYNVIRLCPVSFFHEKLQAVTRTACIVDCWKWFCLNNASERKGCTNAFNTKLIPACEITDENFLWCLKGRLERLPIRKS